MPRLNDAQIKLLDILRNRSESYTLEELAEILGLSNKSSVHYNIKQLEKKGLLKKNPSNPSDYIVLDKQDQGIFYLPLYSGAKCGPDGKLVSDYETAEIPIPSKILNFDVSNAIAIRTEGNSMEPKIPEGSTVIVNKSEIEYIPNKTFLVIFQEQPLIKNLFNADNNFFILSSFNSSYEPFLAGKNDIQILGRVRAVINNF